MAQPENTGAEPFHPQQAPLGIPDDLRRYLQDEFEQVRVAISGFPSAAAYGSLAVEPGPAPNQPLNPAPPQLITGWDTTQPQRPNRMEISLANSSLAPFEAGVYLAQCHIAFELDQGTEYIFHIFVNGLASGIDGGVDASQQTDADSVTLIGLLSLKPGDVVQLFAETQVLQAPHTFIMRDAVLLLTRISEFQHDDG